MAKSYVLQYPTWHNVVKLYILWHTNMYIIIIYQYDYYGTI